MIRRALSRVEADYHGAIDFAELAAWGIAPDQVIDFSVNSNPFGPIESVKRSIQKARIERYPDKACLALRKKLSGILDRPMTEILVGNGTAELLWLVAFACLEPGDPVLIVGPTFGEYARNARLMQADLHTWNADPATDFAPDLEAIEAKLTQLRPKLFHICNPNNPTGQLIELETLVSWSSRFSDTLFVIDEAYIQFCLDVLSATTCPQSNLLVLKSMTKDYALAGIRLGYAVGSQAVIEGLARVQIPWSVNEAAQIAGIAVLDAAEEYALQWHQLRIESTRFRHAIMTKGYRPSPSMTHYFLMDVGNGRAFRERLLRDGMLVRLCDSYSLPAFVRISTRTSEENQCLISALKS